MCDSDVGTYGFVFFADKNISRMIQNVPSNTLKVVVI